METGGQLWVPSAGTDPPCCLNKAVACVPHYRCAHMKFIDLYERVACEGMDRRGSGGGLDGVRLGIGTQNNHGELVRKG